MKSWKSLLQFFLGIGLAAAAGGAVWMLRPRPEIPPGWQIVRPPTDVMALALYQDALWSGGKDGVVRIDPVSGSLLETVEVEGKGFRFVTSLLAPHDGTLWVGPTAVPAASTAALAHADHRGRLALRPRAGTGRRGRWQSLDRDRRRIGMSSGRALHAPHPTRRVGKQYRLGALRGQSGHAVGRQWPHPRGRPLRLGRHHLAHLHAL